jgi:hypothetical protein
MAVCVVLVEYRQPGAHVFRQVVVVGVRSPQHLVERARVGRTCGYEGGKGVAVGEEADPTAIVYDGAAKNVHGMAASTKGPFDPPLRPA